MKDNRFVMGENVFPLKAPVDSGATAWDTPFVDLSNALHCTFFYYVGVMTATSADQYITITLEAATASVSGGNAVAIPFKYRKSAATGTNTWGAVTTLANTGLAIDTTGTEGVLYAFDVDPASLDALLEGSRYVRMVVGIDAGGSVTLNAAWAVLDPMYPQATHKSAAS
jgi:hypothetical protein